MQLESNDHSIFTRDELLRMCHQRLGVLDFTICRRVTVKFLSANNLKYHTIIKSNLGKHLIIQGGRSYKHEDEIEYKMI